MKRNMELVRGILLEAEKSEHGIVKPGLKVDGFSDEEIGYHCYLLGEAGLAKIVNTTGMGSHTPSAILTQITWQGYEFLDAARDSKTWNQAKAVASDAGHDLSNLSLGVLKDLLVATIKTSLGIG